MGGFRRFLQIILTLVGLVGLFAAIALYKIVSRLEFHVDRLVDACHIFDFEKFFICELE